MNNYNNGKNAEENKMKYIFCNFKHILNINVQVGYFMVTIDSNKVNKGKINKQFLNYEYVEKNA